MTAVCPACSKRLDPLRAGHVAIFGERFFYFCDRACRDKFCRAPAPSSVPRTSAGGLPSSGGSDATLPSIEPAQPRPLEQRPSASPAPRLSVPPSRASVSPSLPSVPPSRRSTPDLVPASQRSAAPADVEGGMQTLLALASAARSSVRPPAAAVAPPTRELATTTARALVSAGLVSGSLSLGLALAGASTLVLAARFALALVSVFFVGARLLPTRQYPGFARAAWFIVPAAGAALAAGVHWVLSAGAAESTLAFAALVALSSALSVYLVDWMKLALCDARARVVASLKVRARRVVDRDGATEIVEADDLRPADEVLLLPGDPVAADGVVTDGEIVVQPCLRAAPAQKVSVGQPVVAGFGVLSGRGRMRVVHAGLDRAWLRLTADPRRRADIVGTTAWLGFLAAGHGAWVMALLSFFGAFLNGESWIACSIIGVSTWSCFTNLLVAEIAALHVGRAVLEGLTRAVSYRSAADWEKTAETSTVAFCARSTVLVGEPELADLSTTGKLSADEVIALAAGAEGSSTHPVALAVKRAAARRKVAPDAVRSPTLQAGFGITAVASSGEGLSVGSRALMLKERISVALAEQVICEIEARGRQVLLVAVGDRLVGVLGLQDGIRAGARAAVQQLLDAQIEPVLLSGDSRETCEAIGRALDIEHIRPEIPPADRALEVERLGQGGVTVAVLGHPREDEVALGAADVSVALASAGLSPGEWSLALASEDVRDAALGICLARKARADARLGLVLALGPALALTIGVTFGLLPPLCVPIATAAGSLAAAIHFRATDRGSRSGARTVSLAEAWAPLPSSGPVPD